MAKNTGRGSRAAAESIRPRTGMWDSGGNSTGKFQKMKQYGGDFSGKHRLGKREWALVSWIKKQMGCEDPRGVVR